jgi:Uma2 family endonuclease
MVISRIHSKTKRRDSVIFQGATWDFYKAMLRNYDEQPSRINYNRGTLEVMTLSIEHESYKSVLGMMIGLLALTFNLQIKHGGSSTLKRRSKQKGLEADLCYWIANEPAMRTKKRIDLRTDPPPDLVIEIDVMHSVVNREKIYAAVGVPEMWLLSSDARLTAYALQDKSWQPIEQSLSFPFLKVADLTAFTNRIGVDDDTSVLAAFADWLKQLKETTR